MAIVALVGRKGGCGKSTLATNIAAYFASRKAPITLGDLDHQQSVRIWLARRPASAPTIASWMGDSSGLLRPPTGNGHLVLDTPGGLHGFALSKVVMLADAIVLPASASVFDRESVADCWGELRAHPRVKSGRCKVACVGMRLDGRTNAEQTMREWAKSIELEWIGSLRSAQMYVRAVENGLSIFDMPGKVSDVDLEQWRPLLTWVKEQLNAASNVAGPHTMPMTALHGARPEPKPERTHTHVAAGLAPATVRPLPPRPATSSYQSVQALRTPVRVAAQAVPQAAPQAAVPVAERPEPVVVQQPTASALAPLPAASTKSIAGGVMGIFRKLQYR
jgi:cellulose biosynthesis protein BcsQ